ncbi:hypothetical protein DdX_10133 [Ditylenchus destructor]|uniref:Uncharacterized protein n=1 Tax=Ditylenchus destructor TaxID=166010 RepID=A0AAD4R2L7_9BILA|nr:hypothetical protein DdX_10133 [Ditylenchus destructor]
MKLFTIFAWFVALIVSIFGLEPVKWVKPSTSELSTNQEMRVGRLRVRRSKSRKGKGRSSSSSSSQSKERRKFRLGGHRNHAYAGPPRRHHARPRAKPIVKYYSGRRNYGNSYQWWSHYTYSYPTGKK